MIYVMVERDGDGLSQYVKIGHVKADDIDAAMKKLRDRLSKLQVGNPRQLVIEVDAWVATLTSVDVAIPRRVKKPPQPAVNKCAHCGDIGHTSPKCGVLAAKRQQARLEMKDRDMRDVAAACSMIASGPTPRVVGARLRRSEEWVMRVLPQNQNRASKPFFWRGAWRAG